MENSVAYHLNQINPTMIIYYLHALSLFLCLFAMRGSEDRESYAMRLLGSFIPFIGILIGTFSLWEIIQRAIKSKGQCFLGHSMKHTYDSEAIKWKDGRMPLRLSIGGRDEFTCNRCTHKEIIKWTAF